jgi:hypothetical protein
MKCDLCVTETSHTWVECMNHMQMIKLRGQKDEALEVKAIIQDQIREKKARERFELAEIRKVSIMQIYK